MLFITMQIIINFKNKKNIFIRPDKECLIKQFNSKYSITNRFICLGCLQIDTYFTHST